MDDSDLEIKNRPSNAKWFAAGALLTGLVFSAMIAGPGTISQFLGLQAKADQPRTIIVGQ